jgi:hypothetical protein
MSDFATTRYRKARKPHRCEECRRMIAPGEDYARIAGATDGRAWSVAMCSRCEALTCAAWEVVHRDNMDPEEGPRFGEMVPWLLDALDFPDVMTLLSPEIAGHFAGLVFRAEEAAAR